MPILIPFANALTPPKADRSHAGALHSTIPIVLPTAVVSTAASPANALLLVGDSTSGTIAWTDETTDSNSQAAGDLPVFNGSGDMYYISLAPGDKLESLDWYLSTAGVYTGTALANITYRDSSNTLVQHNNVAVPAMTSVGVKRLMLPSVVEYSALGEIDDPRNPRNARQRAIIVEFIGITSLTTAPLASRFWKRRTSDAVKAVTSFTSLVVDADKTPFATTTILPLNGDRTLLGFSAKVAATFANIVRSRFAGWQTTLIYSKADGTFGDYPAADVHINSGVAGNDELWTAAAGDYVDHLVPPTDWARQSITDNIGTNNLYWLGWRYTADATSPELVVQATIRGALLNGSGSTGAYVPVSETYTRFEMFARTVSDTETWVVLTNINTGATVHVKLASGLSYASSTINLSATAGDSIAVQVLRGAAFFNAADGMFRLS